MKDRPQHHDHSSSQVASRRDAEVAPGKRTLTRDMASRPAALQRKVQHGDFAAQAPAESQPVEDWMAVAVRPDLHQTPIMRKSAHEVGYAGAAPASASASASASGKGMPAAVQAKMENAFGADFSGVRIHEGQEAPQLGALAYTQGSDIHFAPGQYDPGSQRGQELLGHELAHVVQQAEGRVQAGAQAKGAAINDDASLESEADAMGARAARGEQVRGGAGAGPGGTATQAKRAAGVVQRKVGLEIESTPSWQAYTAEYQAITGQNLVVYDAGDFHIETELSGKLEFVIEPPAENTQHLLQIMDRVVAVARAIEQAKPQTKQNVRDDFASEHFKKEVRKDVDLFRLSDVVSGALPNVLISAGPRPFQGGFQATVGVHLSTIPFLFERLQRGDLGTYPSAAQMRGAMRQAQGTREASVGMPGTDYHEISPEMEGLLDLIYYYIAVGRNEDRRPFPKGITQVMARTNFGKMFSMTPEAATFAKHPALWVKLVTEPAGLDPDDRIFRGTFGDTEEKKTTVDLTIGAWLLGMLEGVDRLSVKGGGPAVLKTMGGMDKAEDLGVEGEQNKGAILELRGLDLNTIPLGQWIKYAYEISHMVEQLNSTIKDPEQARKDVYGSGGGGALEWSPLQSQREAGEDVGIMAMEAMRAPFVSQVVGLMMRAKARARSVQE